MPETYDIIRRKRDGHELPGSDIEFLVRGLTSGAVPDYQISAWLMAVLFRGLSVGETLALTGALVESGDRLDLSALGRPVMDKHSTGGVGDKVTLVLGPVIAACGALFGKMSGRALGHTGGTVDKLESITGFNPALSSAEFVRQLAETGIAVSSQSDDLAPADRSLYALRDLTATVESNPLIAASIMSKKIASGSSAVVIDVKVGGGSFFPSRGHASGVASLMKSIGRHYAVDVQCLITSMEQPLGRSVGNSLEVAEAVAALQGYAPDDLREVVIALAARILALSDLGLSEQEGASRADQALNDGSALASFRLWIEAQGGDARFIEEPDRLAHAQARMEAASPAAGFVMALDAREVGRAAMSLGAGRLRLGSAVDHGVGVVLMKKIGDPVETGQALAEVYARTAEAAAEAASAVAAAYSIGAERVSAPRVVLG